MTKLYSNNENSHDESGVPDMGEGSVPEASPSQPHIEEVD